MSGENFSSDSVAQRLRPIADIDGDRRDVVGGMLAGSRCLACGALAFPARDACMACGRRDMTGTALATTGTLYSSTTIHVSSSRPTPYAIGYVDLDDGVRVLTGIAGPADLLQPDSRVRLDPDRDTLCFVPEGDR